MFKHTYHSMNALLTPSQSLAADTLRRMEDSRQGIHWAKPVRRRRRYALAVVAAVLVVGVSLGAVLGSPGMRRTLTQAGTALGLGEAAGPPLAVGENNGLRLEVLGTTNTDDSLSVYYTLQDLEGRDRLDRRGVDLVARLRLNREYPEEPNVLLDGAMWHETVLDYDPNTQTALCRSDFDTNGNYDVTGAEVRLDVRFFQRVINRQEYLPIDADAAWTNPETIPVYGRYVYESDMDKPTGIRTESDKILPVEDRQPAASGGETSEKDSSAGEIHEPRAIYPEGGAGVEGTVSSHGEDDLSAYVESFTPEPGQDAGGEGAVSSIAEEGEGVLGFREFKYIPNEAGSGTDYSLPDWAEGSPNSTLWSVLKPVEGEELFPHSGVRVTGIGFVNGKFCIQTYNPGKVGYNDPYVDCEIVCAEAGKGKEVADDMASLRRMGGGGRKLYDYKFFKSASIGRFELNDQGQAVAWPPYDAPSYEEFYFEITPEELKDYEFFATANTIQHQDVGIQVEFNLGESLPPSIAVYGPMLVGDVRIDKLEITPMGVYVSGPQEDTEYHKGLDGVEEIQLLCGDKAVACHRLRDSGYLQEGWTMDGTSEVKELYLLTAEKFEPEKQEAAAGQITGIKIGGIERPLPLDPAASQGYEALWQAGLDISGAALVDGKSVRVTGRDICTGKIESVQVLRGGDVLDCEVETGGFSGRSAYIWEQDSPQDAWDRPETGAYYTLPEPVDPAEVDGIKINGILLTQFGTTKY